MALRLNKSVEIELDAEAARASALMLRAVTTHASSRAVLASLEGVLSHYEQVEFNGDYIPNYPRNS